MKNVSFKERVKDFAIKKSRQYQDFFCNYDYLVFSTVFIKKKYYFISANPNNYAKVYRFRKIPIDNYILYYEIVKEKAQINILRIVYAKRNFLL